MVGDAFSISPSVMTWRCYRIRASRRSCSAVPAGWLRLKRFTGGRCIGSRCVGSCVQVCDVFPSVTSTQHPLGCCVAPALRNRKKLQEHLGHLRLRPPTPPLDPRHSTPCLPHTSDQSSMICMTSVRMPLGSSKKAILRLPISVSISWGSIKKRTPPSLSICTCFSWSSTS